MKKYICLCLIFFISFVGTTFAKGLDLEKELGKKYKLDKEKDTLACFTPLAIKDIDTIYLKNKKGEVVYTIEIWGSEGNCSWQKDKILFAKNLTNTDKIYITKNYKQKLYSEGNFRLMFKVKKIIPEESLNIKKLKIPYFILINNNVKDDFIFKKDLNITVDLPKKGEVIYKGQSVSYNISILMEDFINLETLSGIYFKK